MEKRPVGTPRRIYLSGPMRGHPDFNKPAFAKAAKILRELGHFVFSPGESDERLELLGVEITARSVFEVDMQYICRYADAIAMLPGWEGSKGARAEKALAEAIGLEVIYLDQ